MTKYENAPRPDDV